MTDFKHQRSYRTKHKCPFCGEDKKINLIKLRQDHECCRTCNKDFPTSSRLDRSLKNEKDW